MNTHNVDPSEVAKFSLQAMHWWDQTGSMRTLHEINPLRLQWINQHSPVKNRQVLDVGCGGGILTEGLAKLGANVTGIDMSKEAIQVAKLHQHESALQIHYLIQTAENHAKDHPEQYDIVTCLEMLEHVPEPTSVIQACAKLVKPEGDIFFSTLNRNLKSYLFAILGAEYLLKLLPKNTHDFAKFIRPSELESWARQSGLTIKNIAGITYNPFSKNFSLSNDVSINYLAHFKKC